jgi:hypothetical protein
MSTLLGPLESANLNHRTQQGPNRVDITPHTSGRKKIQFPKRSVLNNRTMGTVQKPNNSEFHTPSSEPFGIYP